MNTKNIIIEVDGAHHFKDVTHWKHIASENQDRDKYKMKCALDNNHSVIRIVQEDVFNNTIDWKGLLVETIKKAQEKVDVYFISSDDSQYDNHV